MNFEIFEFEAELKNGLPYLKKNVYANLHTTTNALKHFKKELPNISEPSIRRWLSTYRKHLKAKVDSGKIVISERRGRPFSLPEELDSKLRKFLLNIRKAGGRINRHVVSGVLMGLIKSDLDKYGRRLEFCVIKGWLQYLYTRMNLSRKMVSRAIMNPPNSDFRRESLYGVTPANHNEADMGESRTEVFA